MDKDVFDKIKDLYKEDYIAHGFEEHVLRVHEKALQIGKEMEADLKVLNFSALLHDVGRGKEKTGEKHYETSARIARDFLIKEGFEEKFTDQVAECILTHSTRPDLVPKTLEAKILREADSYDALGPYGIARFLITYGAKGYDLRTCLKKAKIRLMALESTFITKEGKKLAKSHLDYMWDFVKRCEEELD